jgi:glucokinase
MVFGIIDGLNVAGRIADIIERMLDDSGIRAEFDKTGKIAAKLKVEQYEIDLIVRRIDD